MIYTLRRYGTPQADRETIAQAILDEDEGVLDEYVDNGTIIHGDDDRARLGFFCIYCLDALIFVRSPSRFFRHAATRDCLDSDQYLGILNPGRHGG